MAAIEELKRVDDRSSAGWNNLMGYSHRKAKVPGHAAAERHCNKALRITPQHKGALEHSGERYPGLNQLPQAEARLAPPWPPGPPLAAWPPGRAGQGLHGAAL